MYPDDLRYSEEHEWIRVDGDTGIVGITFHAQEALGDIVFVELPELGASATLGDSVGSIESVKAVSDIFSPAGGEITEVNNTLEDSPEIVNHEPYGRGWIYKLKLSDKTELDSLMDAEAYRAFLKETES